MLTLDQTIKSGDDPLFIKIDVEGFEYPVLKGAAQLLQSGRVEALIIELCGAGEEFGYSDNLTHDFLCKFGYHPIKYDYVNKKVSLINSYRKDSPNTIYVKNINLIQGLINLSPKRQIQTLRDKPYI